MNQITLLRLKWRGGFHSSRALLPKQFGVKRPDLKTWAARINGPDKRYTLARVFLPMVYPIVYSKSPVVAYDFDTIEAGDSIEVRGQQSQTVALSRFYTVIATTLEHIDLREVSASDVLRDLQEARGRKEIGREIGG